MTTPTLDRGLFLAGLAAAPMVVSCDVQQHPAPVTPPLPGEDWARVRAQFALSPEWVHMAGFQLASHPTRVRQAIERHRRALDENPALWVEERAYDPAPMLKPAAAYMGVQPNEIALADSTTMGLALLYSALPLRAGDQVLTTKHDHYSTYESLRLAALRSGPTYAKLRFMPTRRKPAQRRWRERSKRRSCRPPAWLRSPGYTPARA